MKQAEYQDGIAFFSDPISLGIEQNIYLVDYTDHDLQPRILSQDSLHSLFDRYQADQNRFNELRAGFNYIVNPEYHTLEKRLRIIRPIENQYVAGDWLPKSHIICPVSRGLIHATDRIDASVALRIFAAAAEEDNLCDDEIACITANVALLAQARRELRDFRSGSLQIDPYLAYKLSMLGVTPIHHIVATPIVLDGNTDYEFNELYQLLEDHGLTEVAILAQLQEMGYIQLPDEIDLDQAHQLQQLQTDLEFATWLDTELNAQNQLELERMDYQYALALQRQEQEAEEHDHPEEPGFVVRLMAAI